MSYPEENLKTKTVPLWPLTETAETVFNELLSQDVREAGRRGSWITDTEREGVSAGRLKAVICVLCCRIPEVSQHHQKGDEVVGRVCGDRDQKIGRRIRGYQRRQIKSD